MSRPTPPPGFLEIPPPPEGFAVLGDIPGVPAANSVQLQSAPPPIEADYLKGNQGYIRNPLKQTVLNPGTITARDEKGKTHVIQIDSKLPQGMIPGVIEGHIRNLPENQQSLWQKIKSTRNPLTGFSIDNLAKEQTFAGDLNTLGKRTAKGLDSFASGAVETLGALDENPLATILSGAKSIVKSPKTAKESLSEVGKGALSGDAPRMAEGTNKFIFEAAPALMGLEGALKSGGKLVPPDAVKNAIGKVNSAGPVKYVQDAAASSMIKPKSVDLQFGKDPIGEAVRVKPAATLGKFRENVRGAIEADETSLQQKITDRNAAADSVGADKGFDVGPGINAAYEAMAQQAIKNGKPSLAKQMRSAAKTRLDDMRATYGGTYLTPEQILAEKRILRDEVKFKDSDIEQVTLNQAKLDHYAALDQAFDTLIPGAKELNASYASKIQLDKLLEKRLHEGKNANLISRDQLPEAVFKTNLMKLLNYGKPGLPAAINAYEFFGKPKTNPYDIGTKGGSTRTSANYGSMESLTPSKATPSSGYETLQQSLAGKVKNTGKNPATSIPDSFAPKPEVKEGYPTKKP